MEAYRSMLHPELIFLDMQADRTGELFTQIGAKLQKLGYVKTDYSKALTQREADFPTGLVTKYLPVALPHTDPEYVEKPFICLAKNEKPLALLQMGTNEPMQAQYFFFLGITVPKDQVVLLQKFMQLLQDENFVKGLTHITEPAEMFAFIKQEF